MTIRPISFRDACDYVARHHRHHRPPQGHKFSVALWKDGNIVGVAIVGRPVARKADDGETLEITRLCTDGTKNATSKLLGQVRRIAQTMGYRRVITYTLDSEPGSSLFGAGWKQDGTTAGGSWSRESRKRVDSHPTGAKKRWMVRT